MAKKKKKKAAKKAKRPAKKGAAKKAPAGNPMSVLVTWYAQESKASERMISAIPNDKLDRKIHAKFRSAGELGTHLGDAMNDLMTILKSGKFSFGEPSKLHSTEDILAHYKKASHAFLSNAKKISSGALSRKYPLEMGGNLIWNPTGFEIVQSWIAHEIHHRAHIGVILRVLDARVPGMYGPTADDM